MEYTVFTHIEKVIIYREVNTNSFLSAERKRKAERVEFLDEQSAFRNSGEDCLLLSLISRGCTGFDVVIGRSGLRVRALFPLINEQTKLNATDNVVVADFSRAAARRAA